MQFRSVTKVAMTTEKRLTILTTLLNITSAGKVIFILRNSKVG